MREYTQRVERLPGDERSFGTCWQCCVEGILDLPQGTLPDQITCERAGHHYGNVIRAYLRKHLQLWVVTFGPHELRAPVKLLPTEETIICGPTVRTPTNGGQNHCVVARGDLAIWDPHPSRAGLLDIHDRQFIVLGLPTDYHITFGEGDNAPDCLCTNCVSGSGRSGTAQ